MSRRLFTSESVTEGHSDKLCDCVADAILDAPLMVDTFGTGSVPDELLSSVLLKYADLTPEAIIETLALRKPVYRATSLYGHFGMFAKGQTWESEDIALSLGFRVQEARCTRPNKKVR